MKRCEQSFVSFALYLSTLNGSDGVWGWGRGGAGHLSVSHGVGLSLRSDRTALENTMFATVLTAVLTAALTAVPCTSEVKHCL